jgi:hypothetical protein
MLYDRFKILGMILLSAFLLAGALLLSGDVHAQSWGSGGIANLAPNYGRPFQVGWNSYSSDWSDMQAIRIRPNGDGVLTSVSFGFYNGYSSGWFNYDSFDYLTLEVFKDGTTPDNGTNISVQTLQGGTTEFPTNLSTSSLPTWITFSNLSLSLTSTSTYSFIVSFYGSGSHHFLGTENVPDASTTGATIHELWRNDTYTYGSWTKITADCPAGECPPLVNFQFNGTFSGTGGLSYTPPDICAGDSILIDPFCQAAKWLFIPSSGSINNFLALPSDLQGKVPFAYFYYIRDQINTLTGSSTPAFTLPTGAAGITDNIFTPIKTGLTWLFWLLFTFWAIRKIGAMDF